MRRCLNLKLEEKQQEVEDNIAYYTQREAEFEAKIDELMTRLQEQTAAYMRLQAEFDNYEWWEEGAGGGEGASRESLHARSRPPTREEVHRFDHVAETAEAEEEEEEEEEEEVMEPPQQVTVILNSGEGTTHGGSNGDDTGLMPVGYSFLAGEPGEGETVDPEVPPRRTDKGEEQRTSWLEDGQST